MADLSRRRRGACVERARRNGQTECFAHLVVPSWPLSSVGFGHAVATRRAQIAYRRSRFHARVLRINVVTQPGHKMSKPGHENNRSGHLIAGTQPGTQPGSYARAEPYGYGPEVSRGDTTSGHRDTTAGTHRSSNNHGSGTVLPSGPNSPCRAGHCVQCQVGQGRNCSCRQVRRRSEMTAAQWWILILVLLAGFWAVVIVAMWRAWA